MVREMLLVGRATQPRASLAFSFPHTKQKTEKRDNMADANNSQDTNNELARLDKFVAAAPQNGYNLDQYKQQVCRQLPGNQEECLKLNLEYAQMFSEMQKLGFFCALPMDPTKTHMECRRV
ncbi:hypothetical protein BCR43DRAFT_494703 [Syncephalastrum racemosum]|uniref:Uncharacterized protein n=1 Tax=Syncephalastrum racemosum TaxID=13706 RepID=A0A1X2H8H0_SYNRA|nr:hypothetical protein BCR43DRAFT_494703 [Syncephalastrum racemosum]